MPSPKQAALKVMDTLPEDTSLEDIQYHLYVLQKIEHARAAIEQGKVLTQEEVEQRMGRWLDR